MANEFSVLGKSVVKKDAIEKVTGAARYIPDIQLPGMLHAKFLRSPHAHARIKSIDTSKAEALPGVKCVLTHQNVSGTEFAEAEAPFRVLLKRSMPVPSVHPYKKSEYLLDETVHPKALEKT